MIAHCHNQHNITSSSLRREYVAGSCCKSVVGSHHDLGLLSADEVTVDVANDSPVKVSPQSREQGVTEVLASAYAHNLISPLRYRAKAGLL